MVGAKARYWVSLSRYTAWYHLRRSRHQLVRGNRSCLDFDPCGGRSEGANPNEGTHRADLIEGFGMGAGNMLDVSHVGDVHHCANDMLHSRAGLDQRVSYYRQRGLRLHIGIAAQFRRAGCRAGYKDLVSNANGSRVSVCVFKGVTGRDVLSWQTSSPKLFQETMAMQ